MRWFPEWPEEFDLAWWDGEDLEGVECKVVFSVVFITMTVMIRATASRPSSAIQCFHPSRRPKCPLTPYPTNLFFGQNNTRQVNIFRRSNE